MSSATIFPGTPLSCAQDEYVRRKVSHVARRCFNASHAGKTQRRRTLFGEIGLPDQVAKSRASGSTLFACPFQSWMSSQAVSDNGIRRDPASVFGDPNLPS